MKLKNLLPLALAFTTQALFGQMAFGQSRLPKDNFAFKRDSVDKAIKYKAGEYFQSTGSVKPIITYTTKEHSQDTAHYRILDSDPNSPLHLDKYDLRKEVAQHKKNKLGFIYQANDHYMLLPMENAEILIKQTDQMTKDHHIDSVNLYLYVAPNSQAMIGGPGYISKKVERLNKVENYGIIIHTRLLEAMDLQGAKFTAYHEGTHGKRNQTRSFKEIDTSGLSNNEKLLKSRADELEADLEAAEILGIDAGLIGIAQIRNTAIYQQQDDGRYYAILEKAYEDEINFDQKGKDHPSAAQRLYAVILYDEFKKNSELAAVYISLMSEEMKIALKRQNKLE